MRRSTLIAAALMAPAQAPWLSMDDLKDLSVAVKAVEAGTAKGRGRVVRRFPVNSKMTLITL